MLHAGEDDGGAAAQFYSDVMRLLGGDVGTIRALPMLKAAIERARDVGVLDAIAAHYPGAGWRMTDLGDDMTPTCTVYPTVRTEDARHFTAATPDAARAAAVDAIKNGRP